MTGSHSHAVWEARRVIIEIKVVFDEARRDVVRSDLVSVTCKWAC
ncbi:hypothetical protein [Skermanella pratensis]